MNKKWEVMAICKEWYSYEVEAETYDEAYKEAQKQLPPEPLDFETEFELTQTGG